MRHGLTIGTAAAVAAAGAAGLVWLWRHQGELAVRRPLNEWTFTHMDRLLPVERVPEGSVPSPLPRAEGRALGGFRYDFDGASRDLSELHRRTHTTSLLVIHRGTIVHEEYPGRFAHPAARFQAFSLTKSITSALIGIALERGEITSLDDPVAAVLPELAGSAYDGPTIRHLLDMMSGVGGVEDWTVPDAPINRFERAVTTGGSVLEVLRSTPKVSDPGVEFNYSTLDAHVLGLILEAATGTTLARYASERLWQPMGAEHDAFYFLTRSRPRTALGGGSLNATARDLGRFGLLMARGGRLHGRRIVPEGWVARSRGAEIDGRPVAALQVGSLAAGGSPHYGYSNQWWTLGGEHRAFTGLGVHGQYLWVDPDRETVIVKTSAWNTADDEDRDRETVSALSAIVEHLATEGARP